MKFYEVLGQAIFLKQVKKIMHKPQVMDYYFGALFKLRSWQVDDWKGRENSVVKTAVISRFIGQWI